MSTLAVKIDSHAVDVQIENNALHFILADGREISAPLEWFPRLGMQLTTSAKNGDL